jgi:hypothetical protein
MVERTRRRQVGSGYGCAPSPPELESPDSHSAQVASLIKNQHGLVPIGLIFLIKWLKLMNKVDKTK